MDLTALLGAADVVDDLAEALGGGLVAITPVHESTPRAGAGPSAAVRRARVGQDEGVADR